MRKNNKKILLLIKGIVFIFSCNSTNEQFANSNPEVPASRKMSYPVTNPFQRQFGIFKNFLCFSFKFFQRMIFAAEMSQQ